MFFGKKWHPQERCLQLCSSFQDKLANQRILQHIPIQNSQVWTNFYSSFHLIAFTFHFNCKCFALACFFSLPHQHSSCIKLIQKKIWSRNQILKNGGAQDPERKWIESHCAQCKIRGAYDLEPELCFQRVLVLKIKCNYSF